MRNKSRVVIVIVLVLVVAGVGIGLVLASRQDGGQPEPPAAKDPQAAAEQGLETLRQIVTPENYQALGFQTPDEIKSAQLGQPLTVFRVPLDELRAFTPNRNPEDILVDVSRSVFPVTVNEQVRSSIGVEGPNQQWRATDFGSPKLITSLTQFRQSPSDFIVQIPAFSLYFIARQSDKVLLLTPVVDDDRFGFKAGKTLPATATFATIVPFIDQYNGLPDG